MRNNHRRVDMMNRWNDCNWKYQKHEQTSSDRSKSRYRDRDAPLRRSLNAFFVDTFDCETNFHQIPDLDVPEMTYKISNPHYCDDDIAECFTDYHKLNFITTYNSSSRGNINRIAAAVVTRTQFAADRWRKKLQQNVKDKAQTLRRTRKLLYDYTVKSL